MKRLLTVLVVFTLVASVGAVKENKTPKKRVLVIGLDGATLDTMIPWMEQGKLPNIKKLADKGVVGRLHSVIPYVSPVAWSSFMTGNYPGQHGVYGFQQCHVGEYKPYIPMANDVHGKTLWRILSDNKKKVIVMNVLMTYPLEDVNGVIIGDLLSPGIAVKPYKYKSWLEDEGYIVEGKGFMNTEKPEFLESLYETTDKRVDVAVKLMEKEPDWEFFMILVSGTDRIQHYLWGDMEDKHPQFGNAIEEYYKHVDKLVGQMVDAAGEDTTVILLSDHGFGRQDSRVHINHWLIEKGFMTPEDTWENKKAMWTIRLSGFMKESGISEIIRKVLVRFFKGEKADMQPPKVEIDYSPDKTPVFTCGYYTGQLYMNPKLSEEEYHKQRERLIAELETLRDPGTGEKVIKEIYRREDIYKGSQVKLAPDVIIVPNGNYWIVGGLNYYKLVEPVWRDTGEHRIDGMLIMSGPGVRKNIDVIRADLVDVAPTVLDMFGIKPDMDGKVITEALEKQ
ncbi:MAG: alkaline phosphatase family protein [Candidatus Altiarchaeota archaeon]